MAKAMKRRDVIRQLERYGCRILSEDGPHTKWGCPCGKHSVNLTASSRDFARSGRVEREAHGLSAEGVVAVTYVVSAERWERGWELHIEGVGVTQSRTLADAERMVRDYLRLDEHDGWDTADVVVVPNLGQVGKAARRARERTRDAEAAQREAARESRQVARQLRRQGLSVSDTAAVLGVSRGRVSQLVKEDA